MPPTELLRALALLAEPPGPRHHSVAEVLGLGTAMEASEYADVFMFQLYPYGSVFLGPEGMMGGESRGRIAGFWQAVGRGVPAEPDHLSSLLGLYVALIEESADAAGAQSSLGREAGSVLLHEHLAPWVFGYLERLAELGTPFLERWADLLSSVLKDEVISVGPSGRLTSHFRGVGGLPDPRTDGGEAFMSGLLAPARAGMVLTRADLARFARHLGLGLRAGERRYALEHLMAQDAESVLGVLAAEAERQRLGHEQRRSWLGESAAFLDNQARSTVRLLEELQLEASSSLVAAGP